MKNPETIKTPTIILNEKRAKTNIALMAGKAGSQGVRFRPHFKTHQSAAIGNWFREHGIKSITVSSVKMAFYFAENGWEDILIAFPVNIRELDSLRMLSSRINLGLLVDNLQAAERLIKSAIHADVWIKIDTGMGRAGIPWEDRPAQVELARIAAGGGHLRFRGLLTHAGQTYHAHSRQEIISLYNESVNRINACRKELEQAIKIKIEVSVGDTPGCWLAENLGNVNEIRPGNFIFFDAMMHQLGVCKTEEIALCVACPVISKYEERQEILILGGAVHLSKEVIEHSEPENYGFAVPSPDSAEWNISNNNFIRSLSQEHGIIKLDEMLFGQVEVGDLIYIVPVHSCLVVSALGEYLMISGERLEAQISV